jgi:hypothetical protein
VHVILRTAVLCPCNLTDLSLHCIIFVSSGSRHRQGSCSPSLDEDMDPHFTHKHPFGGILFPPRCLEVEGGAGGRQRGCNVLSEPAWRPRTLESFSERNAADGTDPVGLQFVTTLCIYCLLNSIIYSVYFLSICRYVRNGFCRFGMGTVATTEAQEWPNTALLMRS